MFSAEEQVNFEAGRMLRRYCDCGTLIWEVPSERWLPRPEELILCAQCGKDHSRRQSLMRRWPGVLKWRLARLLIRVSRRLA